jgi:integrase
MRAQLTAAFVDSVKAPELGQQEYWDRKMPAFGLRVSQGGRKTWTLLYRHQRRLRRLTLGTYPILGIVDAREMARAKLADVQHGIDPAAMKREARDADTFAALAERYLSEYAKIHKRESSVREDEKMLRRELLPAWGARKARDIARRDVIALVDGIAARGAAIAANRVLALASKIFNFAVAKEVIEVNPAYRVPKPGKERQRSRVLRDAEIIAAWGALDGESRNLAALFKVLLLTGQRRGEVVGMRWSEVDTQAGWWEIPGERTKNGRAHRVPLVGEALAILKALRVGGEDGFVFPGHCKGHAFVNLAKPLARIIERAGVPAFTIHDLRRTAATGMARAGVAPAVISRVLNHVSGGAGGSRITEIYNRHGYDAEKRAATLKWDRRLASILSVGQSSVVELRA